MVYLQFMDVDPLLAFSVTIRQQLQKEAEADAFEQTELWCMQVFRN